MSNTEIVIRFSGELTIPYVASVGFPEAAARVRQALLDGDGGDVDYSLGVRKVTKLELVEVDE